MSGADLGDDDRGGGAADAGDLIEPGHCFLERGDHLLDPLGQLGDVGVEPVDPGQHLGEQERVMVGEVAGERLLQLADLARAAARASWASAFGSRSPAIRRPSCPGRTPRRCRWPRRQLDRRFSELKMIMVSWVQAVSWGKEGCHLLAGRVAGGGDDAADWRNPGMPRWVTVVSRRAVISSIWASLCGGGEADLQAFGFAGPALLAGFADAGSRLSRISASRGRWAGSGRSSGQRMQACSWMQGVA